MRSLIVNLVLTQNIYIFSTFYRHSGIMNTSKELIIISFRERKTDPEWITLNNIKLPILLNYAQVKLIQGDFYAVIEHCSTVLEFDQSMYFFSYL